MFKRLLTTLVGMPLLFIVLIFGNKYIVDVIVTVLALVSIHEYMKCYSEKYKPVAWIGYVCAIAIAFLHIIPREQILNYLGITVVSIVAILFVQVILTEMKTNTADIAITFFGIIYIVGFFAFIPILFGYEKNGEQLGKFYIWYLFLATWGSDIFAFLIGRTFGKHKFSKISPKKSIEGCIAGIVAGVVLVLVATVLFNTVFNLNANYVAVAIIGFVLTVVGQVGDFAASCIKRYAEVKDFSNLLPGHGGLIDRFDSVIFTAPFAYYLIILLL